MGLRDVFFIGVVFGGTAILTAGFWRVPSVGRARADTPKVPKEVSPADIVRKVNDILRQEWAAKSIEPASRAPELAIMRRISLSLTGSIPSLEEIRRFEARPAAERLAWWVEELLHDRRCSDYLAERLARAMVGTEDGPFILFRRRRFAAWLSDALLANRPYDQIVRDLIAEKGLWTDHPATNFVSVTFDQQAGRPDPERLAARVSRVFLGARIDCAQCHNHPFQPWKQEDFRGLAAYFGGIKSNLQGIGDGEIWYQPPDRKTKEPTTVAAHVPSMSELCPDTGTRREQLAAWVVNPANPSLSRATVNRFWALLFGRPLVDPVDDLPADDTLPPVLDVVAKDFRDHGFDLQRLIRTLVQCEVFQLDSTLVVPKSVSAEQEGSWSTFPMIRLRPEQVAGALYQSASLTTLGPDSPLLTRLIAYTSRNDFVRRYGDTGEDEFSERSGTIPQRLLLMNGDLVRELTKTDLFTASSRIASLATSDAKAVEVTFLAVLTRRPTPEETAHFERKLYGKRDNARKECVADICWTLLNSTEFSWNH